MSSRHKNPTTCELSFFNTSSVIAMMLNFSVYFTLAPDLLYISAAFHVPQSYVLQIPTLYEVGKLIGIVLLGTLSERYNVLRVVNIALGLFCLLGGSLVVWFYVSPPSKEWHYWVFIVVYFLLSMLSVSTQFGLTFLRFVNTKLGYRRVVNAQAILASVLHASLILVGSAIVQDMDWRAPFVFMTGMGMLSFLLMVFSSPPVYHLCDVKEKENDSIFGQIFVLKELLISKKYRQFQAFVFILGGATASMYMYPTYAMQLYTKSLKLSSLNAGLYVFMVYICTNTVARVASLFLVSNTSKPVNFVMVGGLLLSLGSSLFVLLAIFIPLSVIQVAVSGALILAGVGLTMPHCKSGALELVDENMLVLGNSILKIVQLLFSLVSSSIAGVIYQNRSLEISTEMMAMNGLVYIFFIISIMIWKEKEEPQEISYLV